MFPKDIGSQMKNKHPRVVIIDDDPFVLKHIRQSFAERLPSVDVVGITNPIAPVGFDVYIIDRDFGDNNHGQELVQRVKELSPNSMVIAYSAFLDRDYLRALLAEDCEGAFDKGSLEELDNMMNLIEMFLASGQLPNKSSENATGTVQSIFKLVREWNIRLSHSGHAAADYQSDA
jgi:DNA-binding NarL/FixJ family response regulator